MLSVFNDSFAMGSYMFVCFNCFIKVACELEVFFYPQI